MPDDVLATLLLGGAEHLGQSMDTLGWRIGHNRWQPDLPAHGRTLEISWDYGWAMHRGSHEIPIPASRLYDALIVLAGGEGRTPTAAITAIQLVSSRVESVPNETRTPIK